MESVVFFKSASTIKKESSWNKNNISAFASFFSLGLHIIFDYFNYSTIFFFILLDTSYFVLIISQLWCHFTFLCSKLGKKICFIKYYMSITEIVLFFLIKTTQTMNRGAMGQSGRLLSGRFGVRIQPGQTQVVNTGSDSSVAKRSTIGVSVQVLGDDFYKQMSHGTVGVTR